MLPSAIVGSRRVPFRTFVFRSSRTVTPTGSRAAGTSSARSPSEKAWEATEKVPSAAQLKRAQSLRLMTAGLVSLAGAFIIMRAQAVGKTKRSLEQQRPQVPVPPHRDLHSAAAQR